MDCRYWKCRYYRSKASILRSEKPWGQFNSPRLAVSELSPCMYTLGISTKRDLGNGFKVYAMGGGGNFFSGGGIKQVTYIFGGGCETKLEHFHCIWRFDLALLNPVHTMPDKFENATLLLRIRLPSTLIRIKRSTKTELFWKRSPKWNNLKTILFCISVDGELFVSATFRIRWHHFVM